MCRTTSFTLLTILLLVVSPVFAQTWQQLYDQALRDLEAGRWEDAITRLEGAVKQQPASGQSITGGQGQVLRYYPYYLLGKAHFHLGRYPEAEHFFARESRQPNLPARLAQEISGYQQQMQPALAKIQADFNRALEQGQAARAKGALAEAAAQLERARQLNSIEFKARGMDLLLASVRQSEKKRADENRFRLLIQQAEEKEKQDAFQEAFTLLDQAAGVIPGQPEVDRIRTRLAERERTYNRLKEEAANDEREGRLAEAVNKLTQASELAPQLFVRDRLPERLTQIAASISRQAEIQQLLLAAARAFQQGDYAMAITAYDSVLQKDPANSVAVEQRERAESRQLISQAENLIRDRAFEDALAAFSLAFDLDNENGVVIYDRMRPHVQAIRRQNELRGEWLELMREADPDRFKKENPGASATAQSQPRRQSPAAAKPLEKPRVDAEIEESQQKAVSAAIQGPPEEAVRLLERVKATRGKSDAELESWTGVAYARLSLLTSDPEERKRLQVKASEHFKLALRMDPQHELNPRLVAPQIQRIFSEAHQQE